MKHSSPCIILMWLFCHTAVLLPQIILTEVMFNPTGNERYNEFIEIYNTSDRETVDLSGWLIGDGEKSSAIIAYEQGLALAPGQFGVILAPNYFTVSGVYNDLIPDSALVLTINSSQFGAYGLANDRSETVTLYNPDSGIAALWCYHVPNDDGISEEKRFINGNDDELNWGHSRTVNGTPGSRNSITPKEYDAALNLESLQIQPPKPAWNTPLTISINIDNAGTAVLTNLTIIFTIRAANGLSMEEVTDSVKITDLEPSQSVPVQSTLQNIPAGLDSLLIRVVQEQDQEPANDFYARELLCGYPGESLVINEVMYDPPAGVTEWIELYNPQSTPVTIKGWQISDGSSTKAVVLTDSLVTVNPEDFIVIAKDTTIYRIIDGAASVLICKSLPSLANDEYTLVIYDGAGSVMDQLMWNSGSEKIKGSSLERINPQNPSFHKNNWSYCLDSSGHTAGKTNSVYTKDLPPSTRLVISPDPFSPDNDGRDDQAAIQYNLPELTATINIRIFDIKGRMVRFLQNNQSAAASGSVYWDGRDDEGLCCRVGIYIVFLEAKNSRDEWLEQVYGTLVLAKSL